MATKRQNGDPPESVTTPKKTKTQEGEFNGAVFKSMLKDSSKAMKGECLSISLHENMKNQIRFVYIVHQ